MRTRVMLYGLIAAYELFGQTKQFPSGAYLGLRYMSESDEVFRIQRSQPEEHYRFRRGVGPDLLLTHRTPSGIGYGFECAAWVFWNSDSDADPLGRSFKRQTITLPLMANLNYVIPLGRRCEIFLQGSGGMAYTQFVHRYVDAHRVQAGWKPVYGITATVWIGLWNVPADGTGGKYPVGPRVGTSYVQIDGSRIHGIYIPARLGGWD